MSRNLVITTAFGYGPETAWPLLQSLQQYSPATDIVIISSAKDIVKLLPGLGFFENVSFKAIDHPPSVISGRLKTPKKALRSCTRIISRLMQRSMPFNSVFIEADHGIKPSTIQCHFLIRRFFWARELLNQPELESYSNIMLCDIRDVIAQSDPFEGIKSELITGEEFNTIGHCKMNSTWLELAYSKKTAIAMEHYQVLCAGVTLGPKRRVEQYLDIFCEETLDIIRKKRTSYLSNIDQAIHNKIIRHSPHLAFQASPHNGSIGTIGCTPRQAISITELQKISINGRDPSIIHQYDRIPELNRHIQHLYGMRSCTKSNGS